MFIFDLNREITDANLSLFSQYLVANFTGCKGLEKDDLGIRIVFDEDPGEEVVDQVRAIDENFIKTTTAYRVQKGLYYRHVAPVVVTEFLLEMEVAGLNVIQLNSMFNTLLPIILRMNAGAFPLALYELSITVPTAIVTQERLNSLKSKIEAKLI